jgi:tRNA(Ile)-lysidine synthase
MLMLAQQAYPEQCFAATVDHGLRAAAADEAAHVAQFCHDRGISHKILTADLPERAQHGANISARARALRYHLLEAHRVAIGATAILTAHHADDQLETLIMRLNRGTGLSGLAGVRGERGAVARPMLDWTHQEAITFLQDQGISWIEDPSNADDRYDRARLRNAMAKTNILDAKAVARSVALLSEADRAIETMADRSMLDAVHTDLGIAIAIKDELSELKRRLTIRCLRTIMPDIEPRQKQLDRLWSALNQGKTATLGGVLIRPIDGSLWHFSKAPPRTALKTK